MKMTEEIWEALLHATIVDIKRINEVIEDSQRLIETSETEKDKVSVLGIIERWQGQLVKAEKAKKYLIELRTELKR